MIEDFSAEALANFIMSNTSIELYGSEMEELERCCKIISDSFERKLRKVKNECVTADDFEPVIRFFRD